MTDNPSLRPIALFRPMPLPRTIQTGRGLQAPAGLRRSAGFLAALTADRGMTGHVARRTFGFARSLGVFGGHHRFAAPDLMLDLRHRRQRRQEKGISRWARWPEWSAPPALAIPARHQGFIGLPVLPDEAVVVASVADWGWETAAASMES